MILPWINKEIVSHVKIILIFAALIKLKLFNYWRCVNF
jgi:hypothetical protein